MLSRVTLIFGVAATVMQFPTRIILLNWDAFDGDGASEDSRFVRSGFLVFLRACAFAASFPRCFFLLTGSYAMAGSKRVSFILFAWWFFSILYDLICAWRDNFVTTSARRRYRALSLQLAVNSEAAVKARTLNTLNIIEEEAEYRFCVALTTEIVIVLACSGLLPGFRPLTLGPGILSSPTLLFKAVEASGHSLFLAAFLPALASRLSYEK
jgi:hypothetical protein